MLSKDKRAQRYQASCHIKNTDSTSGDQAESNDVPLSSPSSGSSGCEITSIESSSTSLDRKKHQIVAHMPSIKQKNDFTPEEVKKFEKRLEENYDIPDDRYDTWLKMFHPDVTHLASGEVVLKEQTQDPHCSSLSEDANSQLHPF